MVYLTGCHDVLIVLLLRIPKVFACHWKWIQKVWCHILCALTQKSNGTPCALSLCPSCHGGLHQPFSTPKSQLTSPRGFRGCSDLEDAPAQQQDQDVSSTAAMGLFQQDFAEKEGRFSCCWSGGGGGVEIYNQYSCSGFC